MEKIVNNVPIASQSDMGQGGIRSQNSYTDLRDYNDINFRVCYSGPSEDSEMVSFSAQPFELLSERNNTNAPPTFWYMGVWIGPIDLNWALGTYSKWRMVSTSGWDISTKGYATNAYVY